MDTINTGTGKSILKQHEGEESRHVWCNFERQGGLSVSELTEGEFTEDTFGGPAHLQRIFIRREALPSLGKAFGYEHASRYQLMEELEKFFHKEDAYLSELMDKLDAAHVGYGYLSDVVGSVAAYRPSRWDTLVRQ